MTGSFEKLFRLALWGVAKAVGVATLLSFLHPLVAGHGEEGEVPTFEIWHLEWERVQVPYLVAVWILIASFVKIGFHMIPKMHNVFPESSLLIVIGLAIGFLFFIVTKDIPTTLTPDIFFLFLLPPIIMDAGYYMPNRLFFDQLGTILLMAVVGTIFNMFTIGTALWAVGLTGLYGSEPGLLETFLFGSLIAAVDPVAVLAVFEEIQVDEVLNIVVFGESLLNDGVAVVLYHLFEAFCEIKKENIEGMHIVNGLLSFLVVAGGGTGIGIIFGYLCAFLTRFMNHARLLEPILVISMAYLSYLTAEIFHMSGILAITFCGITMKNYVETNISESSSSSIKASMKMMANVAEMIIFIFLGVYTVQDVHDWNWWFVIMTILFCTVFRILGVLLLTAIANSFRIKKLDAVEQFVMMYGGLRGGVAFALVLLIKEEVAPHAKMFVTATLAMVYWTVFVQGITIKPIVKFLKVKTKKESEPSMNQRVSNRVMDHAKTAISDILNIDSEIPIRVRNWYKRLDNSFIKPLLLRDFTKCDPKIMETYKNVNASDCVKLTQSKISVPHLLREMGEGSNGVSVHWTDRLTVKGKTSSTASMPTAYENEAFEGDSDEVKKTATDLEDFIEMKIHTEDAKDETISPAHVEVQIPCEDQNNEVIDDTVTEEKSLSENSVTFENELETSTVKEDLTNETTDKEDVINEITEKEDLTNETNDKEIKTDI